MAHVDEEYGVDSVATLDRESDVMAANGAENSPTRSAGGYTSDDLFKIGGTTIGTSAIGGAIGTSLSPVGAVIGAISGAAVGLVVSMADANRSPRQQKEK